MTLIYHQSDVVAVRCGSLDVSLQGTSGSAWTGIIVDLESGISYLVLEFLRVF